MFAVQASTVPGVLETEIPVHTTDQNLSSPLTKEYIESTFGCACGGVNLIVTSPVMRYELDAFRERINDFFIEPSSQLVKVEESQLAVPPRSPLRIVMKGTFTESYVLEMTNTPSYTPNLQSSRNRWRLQSLTCYGASPETISDFFNTPTTKFGGENWGCIRVWLDVLPEAPPPPLRPPILRWQNRFLRAARRLATKILELTW